MSWLSQIDIRPSGTIKGLENQRETQPSRHPIFETLNGTKSTTQESVIYCRVSTDDQSCNRQEQDLKAYASKAGYQVISIYKEAASGAKDDHKGRKKFLALVEARKIDVVLVTELTRWGRSTPDLLSTLDLLQSRNVSLIAQTGMEFDLSTPFGKLVATFMAGLATFERDLCCERIKSGMAVAFIQGEDVWQNNRVHPR